MGVGGMGNRVHGIPLATGPRLKKASGGEFGWGVTSVKK